MDKTLLLYNLACALQMIETSERLYGTVPHDKAVALADAIGAVAEPLMPRYVAIFSDGLDELLVLCHSEAGDLTAYRAPIHDMTAWTAGTLDA